MEIGGYLEIEKFRRTPLHSGAVMLNSARNCLAYLFKAKDIHEIYIPFYLCDSVQNVCKSYNVKVNYYNIDSNFLPILDGITGKWVYVVNYFGQLKNKDICRLKKANKIIVDNVQDYFRKPVSGVDTIYSCRKFFGVPDGGILYTDRRLSDLPRATSYSNLTHLFGRLDCTASEFYGEFKVNEERINNLSLERMSNTTKNLLCAIDYGFAKRQRTKNFNYLFDKLKSVNGLKLKKVKGAFCYPLLVESGDQLRQKLIEAKIYVPTLWPNVLENFVSQKTELNFTKNILPLPCDQRYNESDMKTICDLILKGEEGL